MNQQEIENQIKAITGNGPVLEELYKLLDDKKAIAFVGAGASAGQGATATGAFAFGGGPPR